MSLVETHELTKRYQDTVALDQCSLAIDQGEVFGLLGPNGAGKSTFLRLLMGFLRPTSGTATIMGSDCYRQSVAVHQQTGYLPGDVRLFSGMHARQLLDFFSRMRGADQMRRALAIADRLELNVNTRVNRMSTGMRQKLALAAVLAAETPFVILDEPTANLDPNIRNRVAEMVREAQSAGRTVLFSSHVLSEVEALCDRVAILRKGRLVHQQVVADLLRQHRIVAKLDGEMLPVPREFQETLRVEHSADGYIEMETPGELQPLLGWLSGLPIREVRIEPIGLRAIYDRFHPPVSTDGDQTTSTDAWRKSEP